MPYAASADTDEVPDPYFGSADHFDHALDLIEPACDGLLLELQRRLTLAA
jgi:protein-tyrosine phosphatase